MAWTENGFFKVKFKKIKMTVEQEEDVLSSPIPIPSALTHISLAVGDLPFLSIGKGELARMQKMR